VAEHAKPLHDALGEARRGQQEGAAKQLEADAGKQAAEQALLKAKADAAAKVEEQAAAVEAQAAAVRKEEQDAAKRAAADGVKAAAQVELTPSNTLTKEAAQVALTPSNTLTKEAEQVAHQAAQQEEQDQGAAHDPEVLTRPRGTNTTPRYDPEVGPARTAPQRALTALRRTCRRPRRV
jgi:hypothetical protein